MANAVEQALLLPKDMANLRSMRKHEVFLDLKRDLAMVSPLTPSFFLLNILLFIFYYFFFFLCYMLLSLAGCSSHVQGRGDGKLLLLA